MGGQIFIIIASKLYEYRFSLILLLFHFKEANKFASPSYPLCRGLFVSNNGTVPKYPNNNNAERQRNELSSLWPINKFKVKLFCAVPIRRGGETSDKVAPQIQSSFPLLFLCPKPSVRLT